MITISNSEGLWSKFKNYFCSSDNCEDENTKDVDVDVSQSNDNNELLSLDVEKDSPLFNVLETPDEELECLKSFENYDSTTQKRVIFKIDKSKFEYPYAKSTTLLTKTNLPIIKSIQSYQEKKLYTDTIKLDDVCPLRDDIYGSYTVDYTEASVRLLVDFSVALYNQSDPTDSQPCPYDIDNIDIYALEDATFLNEPFDFCYVGECIGISPFDFGVEISPVQTEVSPSCELEDYYLYAVDVTITISFLSQITIVTSDSVSLARINALLGKPPTNNVFTRGELASIESINLSENPNLDFGLFQYLTNLKELNISETTSDPDKLEELSVLPQLTKLIAQNNYITDFTPFESLTSLEELYLGNDEDTSPVVADGSDITPLTNLVNLEVLGLEQNNINYLPPELSRLTNLMFLNLSDNNIENLSNLSGLENLKSVNVEGNPVNPSTIPPTLPITSLNLSNTGLNNTELCSLQLPDTLVSLNVSNNNLYDLSCLPSDLSVIALNQQIVDYTTIGPDSDDNTMFVLDVSFIKDTSLSDIIIYDISNGGRYCSPESCYEPLVVWEGITEPTTVEFSFKNSVESPTFDGNITLTLDPTLV